MPTPKRGPRLGAGPAHQKLLLGSQATELFRHGRITTTAAKARALRPYAERLITRAKRGDLHARRMVMRDVRDRDVVAYLFDEIAPRFAERPGGYTRIMKLGPRKGDSAPMVIIELVDRGEGSAEEEIAEAAERRRRGLFGRRRRQRQVPAAEGADLVDDEEFDDEELEEGEPEDRDVDEDELEPTEADDEAPLTGPDVETTLADVEDPSESKGPAQEPTPPAQDPGAPQELRDDTPDAGDTTGG